jgi:H+/Cl- antiporter ClcA
VPVGAAFRRVATDVGLGLWAGVTAGLLSAVFLFVLGHIDRQFRAHPEWVLGLPIAGLISAALYKFFGKDAGRGTALIIDAIHEPEVKVPLRMAPLVLLGTWLTHLGGGSAGREGTAVQMAGAAAGALERWVKLSESDRRRLLMAGVAGGFAAVFGTPWAGAIFGIEATAKRWFDWDGILTGAVAAFVGDAVCRAVGIRHHIYPAFGDLNASGVGALLIAPVAAVVAHAFMASVHGLQGWMKARSWWFAPLAGGGIVVLLSLAFPRTGWNGLSLPLLEQSVVKSVGTGDFAGKLIFTVVTLGFGFKGGEVTPLFVIGATMANALAQVCGVPVAPWAMIGFVTLFAGCSGAPVACAVMAGELFGVNAVPAALVSCALAAALGPTARGTSLYGVHRPWVGWWGMIPGGTRDLPRGS